MRISTIIPAYNRADSYQSVYARLSSPASFSQFKDALTTNPQLKVKVVTLDECDREPA